MDRKMTEGKAFWHAVLTIGLAVLLVAGFLLYLAGPHSENWPAFAVIILVPALIMLPFVYRKYVNGLPPPLTRQQHVKRAVILGLLACAYTAAIFVDHKTGWKFVWQCFYPGGVLLAALDHLWRAYKKEGDLSNPQ
jgi:peptidoglycan/LPS O-acetylase OafA/YrhL